MRSVRWLAASWRRAAFSTKFATVILIAGGVIAVVPLLLAQANTRSEAINRAADKVGVAQNLIQGQRSQLDAFIGGVARQVAATHDLPDTNALRTTLAEDVGINPSRDVLGVMQAQRTLIALQGSLTLDGGDPVLAVITAAAASGSATAAAPDGQPWLVASASVPESDAVAFIGRPVTAGFVNAIAHNLATTADPTDLAVLGGDGRFATPGTVAGYPVDVGAVIDPALTGALTATTPTAVTLATRDVAVATLPLGEHAGFRLIVTTPVDGVTTSWQPVLLLLGLILVSMLIIVVVVQTDLQRPLRRLDRAVAALGRGDFDTPVPTGSDDEVSRLGETFEAMRKQLRAVIRATGARAAVATELSASQPLATALTRVCAEMRKAVEADAAFIMVTGSEMNDAFAIVEGVRTVDIDTYLHGDGPLGEGYRHVGGVLQVGAAPSSREAHLGLREFCVAPLRVGNHVHGVISIANRQAGFLASDADLVASTAEQVALALERYRFLAVVQKQASIDDLTGLYNHRFLVDYLGQQVALAERLNAPLAILMLDIDHFKFLNDTHGHQAGDSALAAFAQTLVSSVRRADLAARYGGEEFAVVMANTSADEARLVAEKIRVAVADSQIDIGLQATLQLTVSIGGAAFPEDTDSARELLTLADEALYRAKRTGRDRTCMAGDNRRHIARAPIVTMPRNGGRMKKETGVGAGGRGRSAK
jgi:diguanylate cyclase (GGDEF)-like protein